MTTFLAFTTGLFGGLSIVLGAFSFMACCVYSDTQDELNKLKEAEKVEA